MHLCKYTAVHAPLISISLNRGIANFSLWNVGGQIETPGSEKYFLGKVDSAAVIPCLGMLTEGHSASAFIWILVTKKNCKFVAKY